VFPAVPAGLGDARAATQHLGGWRFLQAGDLGNAEREFRDVLKRSPGFYPADVGLGDVRLAQRNSRDALAQFDRALRRAPAYVPALAGRGEALLGLDRVDEALESLEAAVAADPTLAAVQRRIEVLRFRHVQAHVTDATRASDAGRLDEARQSYLEAIAASPQTAFLYRDLADVERRLGRVDDALQHLEKSVALDPTDAGAFLQMGEALEAQGRVDAALAAYGKVLSLGPDDALRERAERARDRIEAARLPADFRAIAGHAQITRGDLAAVIGIRLGKWLQEGPRLDATVITDARSHWASQWIMAVARAGIMEVYPNHTFQPNGLVRRADLAGAASRVLSALAVGWPRLAQRWQTARPAIADLPPGHLSYPAAVMVVAAGVMPLLDGNAFRPSRVVAGKEAVEVVDRLRALSEERPVVK
jgi:tetratricopeptide (TPR) repeat protein